MKEAVETLIGWLPSPTLLPGYRERIAKDVYGDGLTWSGVDSKWTGNEGREPRSGPPTSSHPPAPPIACQCVRQLDDDVTI